MDRNWFDSVQNDGLFESNNFHLRQKRVSNYRAKEKKTTTEFGIILLPKNALNKFIIVLLVPFMTYGYDYYYHLTTVC